MKILKKIQNQNPKNQNQKNQNQKRAFWGPPLATVFSALDRLSVHLSCGRLFVFTMTDDKCAVWCGVALQCVWCDVALQRVWCAVCAWAVGTDSNVDSDFQWGHGPQVANLKAGAGGPPLKANLGGACGSVSKLAGTHRGIWVSALGCQPAAHMGAEEGP